MIDTEKYKLEVIDWSTSTLIGIKEVNKSPGSNLGAQ